MTVVVENISLIVIRNNYVDNAIIRSIKNILKYKNVFMLYNLDDISHHHLQMFNRLLFEQQVADINRMWYPMLKYRYFLSVRKGRFLPWLQIYAAPWRYLARHWRGNIHARLCALRLLFLIAYIVPNTCVMRDTMHRSPWRPLMFVILQRPPRWEVWCRPEGGKAAEEMVKWPDATWMKQQVGYFLLRTHFIF